jgi:very-long-chain enoyl-CoA reductase
MSSKSLSLSIRPRGKPIKNLPTEVSLPANASASDLYECVAANARSSVRRLRIIKGSDGSWIPNAPTLALHSTGLRDQSSIYVKDLGETDVCCLTAAALVPTRVTMRL